MAVRIAVETFVSGRPSVRVEHTRKVVRPNVGRLRPSVAILAIPDSRAVEFGDNGQLPQLPSRVLHEPLHIGIQLLKVANKAQGFFDYRNAKQSLFGLWRMVFVPVMADTRDGKERAGRRCPKEIRNERNVSRLDGEYVFRKMYPVERFQVGRPDLISHRLGDCADRP